MLPAGRGALRRLPPPLLLSLPPLLRVLLRVSRRPCPWRPSCRCLVVDAVACARGLVLVGLRQLSDRSPPLPAGAAQASKDSAENVLYLIEYGDKNAATASALGGLAQAGQRGGAGADRGMHRRRRRWSSPPPPWHGAHAPGHAFSGCCRQAATHESGVLPTLTCCSRACASQLTGGNVGQLQPSQAAPEERAAYRRRSAVPVCLRCARLQQAGRGGPARVGVSAAWQQLVPALRPGGSPVGSGTPAHSSPLGSWAAQSRPKHTPLRWSTLGSNRPAC